jgi:hypothetical protein
LTGGRQGRGGVGLEGREEQVEQPSERAEGVDDEKVKVDPFQEQQLVLEHPLLEPLQARRVGLGHDVELVEGGGAGASEPGACRPLRDEGKGSAAVVGKGNFLLEGIVAAGVLNPFQRQRWEVPIFDGEGGGGGVY